MLDLLADTLTVLIGVGGLATLIALATMGLAHD